MFEIMTFADPKKMHLQIALLIKVTVSKETSLHSYMHFFATVSIKSFHG